jgi:hypothetical protein
LGLVGPLRRVCPRRTLLDVRLVRALAASVLLVAACSGDGGDSTWARLDDIDYLVSDALPDGWVVSTATLRPGRPQDEWTYRVDLFANEARDDFLVLVLTAPATSSGTRRPIPDQLTDADADDLAYTFGYLGVNMPRDATAQRLDWSNGTFGLTINHVGIHPANGVVVQQVVGQFDGVDDFDHDDPSALADAGYSRLGTLTEIDDVADYSVVWTDAAHAGRTRAGARDARDGAPQLWLNVGARMFAVGVANTQPVSIDPDDAKVEDDDGSPRLRFLRDGIPVTVGGSGAGIDAEVLRRFADGLRALSYDDWVEAMGDRLLVDEPEER